MSDLPLSDQDTPSGSNKGGHRTPGQRSAKTQARRDATMKATKEAWGVSDYNDIFPANIRPDIDLGDSAVLNLKSISNRVQQLPAARVLMTKECVDKNGNPVKLSFKHTNNILNHLKEQEAKEVAERKKNVGDYDKGAKIPSPSISVSVPDLEEEKRVAVASKSALNRGSAGVKVSKGSISSMGVNNLSGNKDSTPGKHSVPEQTVIPAIQSVPSNVSRLSKVKAPIPITHLNTGGKSSSKSGRTSLIGDKRDSKEVISGLHVPSAKDKAPFKGSRNVVGKDASLRKQGALSSKGEKAIEKPSQKKRVSFAPDEEIISPGLIVAAGSESKASTSGARVVVDQKGVTTDLNAGESNTSGKRISDGADEPGLKKMKFSKGALLSEPNSAKRPSPLEVAQLGSRECSSEAETEIDESFAESSGNEPKRYTFGEGGKAKVAGDEGTRKHSGDATKDRDDMSVNAAGDHGIPGGGSINRPKRLKQAKRVLASNLGDPASYHTSEDMAAVFREMDKEEEMSGREKTTPTSPKNSPDREEDIHSIAGRRLSKLHDSKRVKTTRTFLSPNTKLMSSPDLNFSDIPSLINQESSVTKKDIIKTTIMGYNFGEEFDKAEQQSDKATEEDDTQLTPKAAVAPARGNIFARISTTPSNANITFPKIPEILDAFNPAHRAFICSIPGEIKTILQPFIEELQAAIPAGAGPDGDLLSMIIVNKLGYLLNSIDTLDKDLKSVYYQRIDRNEELERQEAEEKERKEKAKGRKRMGMDRYL